MMTTSEVRCGALCVKISVDDAGVLHSVTLPAEVPEGLTSKDLARLLGKLEKYALHEGEAPFLRAVWREMRNIPWGHARTYQELAAAVGSPRGMRAVGQACARNPLPLIVPCHRVLAETGLGGFAYGLRWKSALLALETEPRAVVG